MALSRRTRILVRSTAVLAGIALGSVAILALYGTALVDQALSGAAKRTSTRVLSAPLELKTGDPWDAAGLRVSLVRHGVRDGTGHRPLAGEFTVDAGSVWLMVWVGTDGNSETGLYGATGALEIWRQIDGRMPPVWQGGDF
jgi:hypothetical protein